MVPSTSSRNQKFQVNFRKLQVVHVSGTCNLIFYMSLGGYRKAETAFALALVLSLVLAGSALGLLSLHLT